MSQPSDPDESSTETLGTDEPENPEDINPPDDALLLQSTPLPELALHVSEERADPQPTLFAFDTLQHAAEPSQVCLAENGLPFFEEPLECGTEECFVLEVPMKQSDMLAWSQEANPEQMCQVAAASQRARSEVQVKTLTPEERKLFDVAKDNELSCWISTNSLKPIMRQKLNPDQILRSRWVLTWKDCEANGDKPAHRRAKARLVVLGNMHPQITNVVRDSPTLSLERGAIQYYSVWQFMWELTSFDIKTAFLRGKADESNPIAMEPPKELRQKLGLSDNQVCSLVGHAYGRVDAPLLFYKELSRHLHDLHFKTHPLEPCVFILESGSGEDRKLHGIVRTRETPAVWKP
eukprot:s2689_g8.t1